MNKIETLEDVKERGLFASSNFDDIINASLQVLQEQPELASERGMDIGDTPISPMALNDNDTPIIVSENVMPTINELVTKINVTETAKEYMFVLLGRSGECNGEKCYLVDQMVDCSAQEELSSRITKTDQVKLNEVIQNAVRSGYDFISIGHTHPNIPQEEREATIASFLSDEVKSSEFIREAGLNLSLRDFESYDSLYQYFADRPNIRTALTVIMFNGEVAMVNREDSSLSRFTLLMDQTTGEEIYVSSREEFNNKTNRVPGQ